MILGVWSAIRTLSRSGVRGSLGLVNIGLHTLPHKPTSGPNSIQIETAPRSGTRRCCVLGQGAQHGIEQIPIVAEKADH